MDNTKSAAIEYLKYGFSVIPVNSNKRPCLDWKKYQKEKTTVEEIEVWWEMYPGANVGIVTGEISNLSVIDIDSQEGKSKLKEVIPDSLRFPIVNTPRGGKHFYFRYHEGLRSNVRSIPGCDLRSDGGYVVAPPSIDFSGKKYEWVVGLDEVAIPNIPKSYLLKVEHRTKSFREALLSDSDILVEGRRNNDLFHFAYMLAKEGKKEEEIIRSTLGLNKRCSPSLSEKEVLELVHSAASRAKKIKSVGVPIIKPLSSYSKESVDWLWEHRIPLGKLSFIIGDPGVGKSFLSVYIASKVTLGAAWPDTETKAPLGSVIILTAEDGIGDTVRKRFEANGADLDKILVLEGILTKGDHQEFFNIEKHLSTLGSILIERDDVRLIILDSLDSYLGKVDGHKYTETKSILAPLTELGNKYKVSILGIRHMNKSTHFKALYRGMGSVAFAAEARVIHVVVKEDTSEKRLFIPIKNNLVKTPKALAFSIVGDNSENATVEFDPTPIDIDADTMLSVEKREEALALSEAKEWLNEMLQNGPVPSSTILKEAKDNGISEITLRRAKKEINKETPIKVYRSKKEDRYRWYWKKEDKNSGEPSPF